MTQRPARLLYLGVVPEDFEVLARRIRPAPHTEIRTAFLSDRFPDDHPDYPGLPRAPIELAGYECDAVIYSPHIGDPAEQEAIFDAVLRQRP